MSILPPKGRPPSGRRPTLKGAVQQDIAFGQERSRIWPRPRGRAKTTAERERQEKFRLAQLASKYMAPQIMASWTDAVRGTPLLPRDMSTAMLYQTLCTFQLEDGKEYFPVANRIQVSDTLDILSQTIGDGLVRTEQGWQGVPLANPQLGEIILEMDIPGTVPFIQIDDIAQWTYVAFMITNVSATNSGNRIIRYSVDNGVTFPSANGDYFEITEEGNLLILAQAYFHLTLSASGKSGICVLGPNLPGLNLLTDCRTRNRGNYCPNLIGPATNARILNTVGNLTAGHVIAMGWR